MTKAQHTPGPWKKSSHSNLIKAGDLTVCVMMERDDKEIEAANVLLVETAPNLLAAASEVMSLLEKHGTSIVPHLLASDENAGQRLRDAIAKALGENAELAV